MTIHNDEISYVKHVLDPLVFMCFFTLFGFFEGGWGSFEKARHNLTMQFSTLYNSQMEVSKSNFFDILTIHNDQISCGGAPR